MMTVQTTPIQTSSARPVVSSSLKKSWMSWQTVIRMLIRKEALTFPIHLEDDDLFKDLSR